MSHVAGTEGRFALELDIESRDWDEPEEGMILRGPSGACWEVLSWRRAENATPHAPGYAVFRCHVMRLGVDAVSPDEADLNTIPLPRRR